MQSINDPKTLAASELVGTLILSALIVLVIGIVAVTLLSQGPPVEVPALRVDIHNDSGALVLINRGGDTLFREKTRIFVDGVEQTANFILDGESWVEYGAGDWLVLPGMFRDDVSVQIVHTGPEVPALLFTIGDIGVPPGPGPDTYQLTLVASPAGAGTLTGAGFYQAGAGVPVNAVANPGWIFSNWTRNGVLVSASPGFTYTMLAESVTLVANFEIDPTVKYNLTLVADPLSGGTVNGSGFYEAGEVVPVSAEPNAGYLFINWTQNGVEISNTLAFNFTMPAGDVTLVANFIEAVTYTLTLQADPETGGVVTGGGNYTQDADIPITALPTSGYTFISWTRNGNVESLNANFTYTMPAEDVTLVANFDPPGVSGFTAEAWVRWNKNPTPNNNDQQWATIVIDGDADGNSRYHFQHDRVNSRFEFAIRTANTQRTFRQGTTTPMQGVWYYVVGVYNEETGHLRIYVNGVEENSASVSTDGLIPSPGRYQVGGPAGIEWPGPTSMQRKFNGNILCLGTHERAFTPQEILDKYNAGCPPVVAFTANVTTGETPLAVQFTDLTTHSPTAWAWDFGDGGTSTLQNPTHTYLAAGTYTVSLTVTKKDVNNLDANVTGTKIDYITIEEESFVDFVIDENVFVYGNVLNFQGGNVNGPGATVVITGGLVTSDLNQGAAVAVSTIYIDGNVNLDVGSAGLGSSVQPGNIYVNGNMRLWMGKRHIYGDVYVNGNFDLKDARIHGNVYVDGDLTLGDTPWLADDARIYYTGTITHPASYPADILAKCIPQATVPGFDMPDQEIPPAKAADWYAARGYASGGALTSNMKVFADSYSFEPTGDMNAQNVIIIARDGDITLRRWGGSVTGVLFAPKGKVTFLGDSFEGLVIARDGFFVESGGTEVTFKNLDQYIGDPNDYPF